MLPCEIIVVDDCSAENLQATINRFGDHRIRLIRLETPDGAQAARNRGIKEASGDWIAFQDSDDEWLPDKLGKQVAALASVGLDPNTVVHSDAIRYNVETGEKAIWKLPPVNGKQDVVYPSLLAAPAPLFPALLVSKKALSDIGLLDENVPSYQEWDTSIRLAEHCRFIHLEEPLFIYNIGMGISSDTGREIDGYRYVIEKHRVAIKNTCGEEVWKRHLRNLLGKCLRANLSEKFDEYCQGYSISDGEIAKVFVQEMCVALDEGRWEKADLFRSFIKHRGTKVRILEACRHFHLRPKHLSNMRKLIKMVVANG